MECDEFTVLCRSGEVPRCGRQRAEADALFGLSGTQGLKSVQNDRVFAVDSNERREGRRAEAGSQSSLSG